VVVVNKEYIIKKNIEFNNILKKGRMMRTKNFCAYVIANDFKHPRFGISVPKKLGNAVIRNKIKRQSKEIIRQNIDAISKRGIDVVILINKNFVMQSFSDKISLLKDFIDKELTK